MANTSHLKRHSMPKSWNVKRKNVTFISRPAPGAHKKEYGTSIIILLRDILGYVKTKSEAVYAVKNTEILVNGAKVTSIDQPCGLFDIIEIKATKEKFTLLFNEVGRLKIVPTKDDLLIAKVIGKQIIKGGKFQITLFNGFNVLVDEKQFKALNVEDSVAYDVSKKKITETMALDKGAFMYIFDGNFKGRFGEVKEFTLYNGLSRDVATIQIGTETHTTAKDYCYVVGKSKEALKRFE